MIRAIVVALCVVLAGGAHAQKVYKWVMPDGTIRYSDRPQEDGAVIGEEVAIDAAPTPAAGAPRDLVREADEGPADAGFQGYEEFAISSPKADEAIRDNGGNVSIQLSLKPGLQENHVIEILMDGKSLGTGRTMRISMTNVDRGSHTVQAAVRNAEGEQVAATGAVTFNLLRVAAGG